MKAYYFRLMDDNDQPTNFVGIAVAKNMADLFWAIDEFGDPYRCQIMPVTASTGVCMYTKVTRHGGAVDDVERSDIEVSENFPYPDEGKKWKKPEWPNIK